MTDLLAVLLRHRHCPHHRAADCAIANRDGCACREAIAAIRRVLDREARHARQMRMQLEAAYNAADDFAR